jgi:hypothetical protein
MVESDLKNPVWSNLVFNKTQVNLNFLAGKILLARLQQNLKNDASPAAVEKAKKELFELYLKSMNMPSAQKDISLLLKK